VYQVDIVSSGLAMVSAKKIGALSIKISCHLPLTYSGNVFRFMKLEQLMAGEDYEPEESCSELAGTHFTIRKIKFR
jgi:hypothetical protein